VARLITDIPAVVVCAKENMHFLCVFSVICPSTLANHQHQQPSTLSEHF